MESVTIQVEHQVERTVQRCTVQRPAVHDMTRADTPLHSAAMYAVKILQLKTTHSQSVKRSKDGLEKFEKLQMHKLCFTLSTNWKYFSNKRLTSIIKLALNFKKSPKASKNINTKLINF